MIPHRPWKSKSPFASRPMKASISKGTQGVRARYDAVPCPSFPCFFLFYQGKTLTLTKDFCPLPNPLKPWKKQRKYTNNQGTSLLKINQGTSKNQGRKDRVLLPFISIVWSPGRPVISAQQVLNLTPLNPTPAALQHATSENGSCTAVFGVLRCRNCTATLSLLQCGSHLDQKLRCSKRKTALQHRKGCFAGTWRFPAAFLRLSSPHV